VNFAEERLPNDPAADYIGVAPVTLKNSRATGKLGNGPAPEYFKIGKKVFYTKPILDRYINNRRVVPTLEHRTAISEENTRSRFKASPDKSGDSIARERA